MKTENTIAQGISNEVLQLLPDAVIVVDGSGTISLVNEQATKIFGYNKNELLGQKIEILIPKKYRNNHSSHRHSYSKHPSRKLMSKREELFGKRKDGSVFPVEITLGPVNLKNNSSVIAIVRDTSSRHYIELLESKNKELEQFVYIASHDLQEPLRTVKNFTEMLDKNYSKDFDDKGQKMMGFINEATNRMSQLIKGLLDYSRIGRNRVLVLVDCNQLLKDIQIDLASAIYDANATIEINELPIINGYETELRLLFQNLISNALKFRKPETLPLINISANQTSGCWQFKVQDNGIGIQEEHKDRIFNIFQRLYSKNEYEGTGIGLAHCQKVVELHGGKLWVESQPNKGSVFYFNIPI